MNNSVSHLSDSRSTEAIIDLVKGELSSRRRWLYRLFLVAAASMLAAMVSLWLTEPGPLPLRLHISFAAMCSIATGWVCVLGWVLLRKQCPTALDRIATCWMATFASGLSLCLSVAIAVLRNQIIASLWLGLIGGVLFATAVLMLRNAYRVRNQLRGKLEQLRGPTTKSVA